MSKLENIVKKTIAGLYLVGLLYGTISFPYDNVYTQSRACAGIRTDKVKKQAISLQKEFYSKIKDYLK